MNENTEDNVLYLRSRTPKPNNGFIEPASRNDKKLSEAQNLVYDAWEMDRTSDKKALAKAALAKSNLCADAHNILADCDRSAKKRLERYQMAVKAAHEALGDEYIESIYGMLWEDLDSRPYVRALAGLSQTYYELERKTEARETAWKILDLNESDNMGMRYILLSWLLEEQDWKNTDRLLRKYDDDGLLEWAWGKVLRAHAKGLKSANKLLNAALRLNPHVPAFLTGKRKLPKESPPQYLMGSKEEAISYCIHFMLAWRNIPGALDLLANLPAKNNPA